MEKDTFIKARIAAETKKDFDDICQTLGVQPTSKVRELVEAFVQREYGRLEDRLTVHIYHPTDYDFGAWRVKMRLRNPAAINWQGNPVPFAFPQLPKRRLHPDEPYLSVVQQPGGNGYAIGGHFVNGTFEGHLYSNGIEEEQNPTSIEEVREALARVVIDILDRIAASSPKPN